jgi:hypothetical protein
MLLKVILLATFLGNSVSFFAIAKVSTSDRKPENKSQNSLLEKLAINEGKGHFTQDKYFKFLTMPITSTGTFIVNQKTAVWQTQQPVFSQLLLTSAAIYQRQALTDDFQTLINNSDFSAVLATIFTGKISRQDWNFAKASEVEKDNTGNCLVLTPKSEQLQSIFSQVELCLVNDSQTVENVEQERSITLLDKQGNKTEISMFISNDPLSPQDITNLVELTQKAVGKP